MILLIVFIFILIFFASLPHLVFLSERYPERAFIIPNVVISVVFGILALAMLPFLLAVEISKILLDYAKSEFFK
jgi:hypothetical protein